MADTPTNNLISGREKAATQEEIKEEEPGLKGELVEPAKVVKELLKESLDFEDLTYCYECGTCTAACPVAAVFPKIFNPRTFFQELLLNSKDALKELEPWLCAMCDRCHRRCPHKLKLPEIFILVRTLSVEDEHLSDTTSTLKNILKILEEEIPFPIVFSWLCLRPSEEDGKSAKFDETISTLLRNAINERKSKDITSFPKTYKEKIAVIGSGPSGLTAAWELAKKGFPVTVFESLSESGGMMRVGIPEYRLPKDVLDEEIEHIKKQGIDIKTNVEIGKDLSFESLMKDGEFKAILIATGAHKSGKLRIEGEELENVIDALDLLKQYNTKEQPRIGKKVVVIGGGNVAMDGARVALRNGAEEVQLFCLESRAEMPSHEWEIREAVAEGVVLNTSWGPRKILGNQGKVTGVEFIRCTSVFDENGWFNPVLDDGESKTVEADTVILAIGQIPDLSFLGENAETFGKRWIEINPITAETNLPGVFAGGDVVLGPATVIEAIATGKMAARSIERHLRGENGQSS